MFAHDTIDERGSPLQYDDCFAVFIKFVLTYSLHYYLRASDERPYSLVCTNYLHELTAEALGYWLLEEIGLLFKLYNFKYAYF